MMQYVLDTLSNKFFQSIKYHIIKRVCKFYEVMLWKETYDCVQGFTGLNLVQYVSKGYTASWVVSSTFILWTIVMNTK